MGRCDGRELSESEGLLKRAVELDPTLGPDLYKFHQERVETLRSRHWTVMAWLAALQGALLGFAFKELKIRFRFDAADPFTMADPLLVLVLAIFGIALSFYMIDVIDDGTRHIETNWRRSDIALGKSYPHKVRDNARLRRRKHAVYRVMAPIATATRAVQLALAALAALILVEQWFEVDVPLVGIPAVEPASAPPSPDERSPGPPPPRPRPT